MYKPYNPEIIFKYIGGEILIHVYQEIPIKAFDITLFTIT